MSDQSEIPGQSAPQDQAGHPPNPYYQPGYGYPMLTPMSMPPQRGTNGMAIAGIILSVFFWPLGLIFSIIGLVRSKALGGTGRTVAVVGLVLSAVFGVGTVVGAVALVKAVSNAPALDRGCRYTEPATAEYLNKISNDMIDIAADGTDPTAEQQDATATQVDLQGMQTDFDNAVAVSVHPALKTAAEAVDADITAELADVDTILTSNDNGGPPEQLSVDYENMVSDTITVNSICATF